MSGVRSLASRVKRLQAARAMASPFQRAYGSLDGFEAAAQAGIDAGLYDARDMPVVLHAVRGWHEQDLWATWQ